LRRIAELCKHADGDIETTAGRSGAWPCSPILEPCCCCCPGANTTTGARSAVAEGDIIGRLYDDGKREHDDRYAGDGLYTNKVILEFDKREDVAVYKEFYVSLLQELVSSTVEIAGTCHAPPDSFWAQQITAQITHTRPAIIAHFTRCLPEHLGT
jgi:hypothetical protein